MISQYFFDTFCINRNIVECKAVLRHMDMLRTDVLIETLWNVKTIDVFNLLEEAFRINRNIVECKEKSTSRDLWVFFYVLIETLWNVKLICL